MSDLFRNRMARIGGAFSESVKHQSIAIREAKFREHVGFKMVKVNGVDYEAHFTPSTEFSANEKDGSYYIEFRNGVEFPMGTYVYIPREQKGYEPWMITSRPDSVLVKRPSIQKCNILLRWQHEDSAKVIERLGVLRRPYSSTIDHNDYIQYSIKEYRIFLPLDEDTKKLHVDHRLVMEESNGIPLTYVITAFDSLSEAYSTTETLLAINVQQTASTEHDSLEHMVADYIDEQSSDHSFHIVGEDVVRIGGTGTVFEAAMEDNHGNVVAPVWEIVANDGLDGQYNVDYLDNTHIRIVVHNDHKLIGNVLKVSAHFPAFNVEDSKLIKVVGII